MRVRPVVAANRDVFNLSERIQRLHQCVVILHRHAQRNIGVLTSIGVARERRAPDAAALFFRQVAEFLGLVIHLGGTNPKGGLLQRLLLFLSRDRDIQHYLVALGLRILTEPFSTLGDTFGLDLEVLDPGHRFHPRDDRFALFRCDQHVDITGHTPRIIAVDLGIGDLDLGRGERLDFVVGLLDLRRVEGELSPLLQQERRGHVHVLLGKLDCHRGEVHLGIHELEFALHRLDLFAHPAELLFHLKQVGHVLALRF